MAQPQRKMRFAQKFRQLLTSSFRSKRTSLWMCIACDEDRMNNDVESRPCTQSFSVLTTGDGDLASGVVSPVKPKSILKNSLPPLSPAALRRLTKPSTGFLFYNKSSNSLSREQRYSSVSTEYNDVRSSLSSASSKNKRVTFNEDILESLYELDSTGFVESTSHYPNTCGRNRF